MTDKVKQLAPQIWAEIQKANNILLHCHPSPDGDSIGSSLGMFHALKNYGKNVTVIYGDSKKKEQYNFFPGFDEVIEKDYFSIDPSKFDLFIILDSSNTEQISKHGVVTFPENLRTVVIDHHFSDTGFGQINLVDSTYPATCQMVYELLTQWKITIPPEAAVCLYVGLYTDTGGFKYFSTSPDTLSAASGLATINPNFTQAIFALENSNDRKQIEYLALALNSIEHYFFDKLALSAISFSSLKQKNIEAQFTEKMDISNILKSVVGWEIGACLTETEPGVCNLSLRTRDPEHFDLSKLAQAVGGGGHKVAAGATIKKPFEEAKKLLIEKVQEVYPDLRQGN